MRIRLYGCLLLCAILLVTAPASAQDKGKSTQGQIPQRVMQALMAKFPNAQIDVWTKEQEDGVTIYDIEFRQSRRRFEADVKEDGSIHNWEREVSAADVPVAVRQAVRKRFPGASITAIMAVTAMTNGKEALEGFEVTLLTAARKEAEITVAPSGKILEDAGTPK